jgi:pimeloyl-ACP methyl ester carboxylesterase
MIPAAAELDGRYRELAMPVGIMVGRGDEIVDTGRHSQRLHRELPGSELRIIDGAGHLIHHVTPPAVVDLIRSVEGRAGEGRAPQNAAIDDHHRGHGARASGSIQADL